MILENLDKSLTIAVTIGSAAFGLWGHNRAIKKERVANAKEKLKIEAEAQKAYADKELKRYASERDFNHIQRDLDQLKANTAHLSEESDARLDRLERQVEKLLGAVEVLTDLTKAKAS